MFDFNNLMKEAETDIKKANDLDTLELIHIKFFGKKGYFNQQIKILHDISSKSQSHNYMMINQSKKNIRQLLLEKKNVLEYISVNNQINKETLDVSLPGRQIKPGGLHPITHTMDRIIFFFKTMGFSVIYGPEIEDSYHNFDSLNIPSNHPARDNQDTFWINTKYLLRTQTSGVQIRSMEIHNPPIRIISPGRVYRKDYDKHHTPMFHQIEGLIIDKNINFSNLKATMYDFLKCFFLKKIFKIRFRPSYFPFTEPSAEVDIDMTINNDTNQFSSWIEVLGCGMVHPNVLENVNIDYKQFSGFAFGIGIERLAMLYYGITDLRLFFENDLRFLKQFQ